MLSALATPKSLPYVEIFPENLLATPTRQESALQKSEILSLHLINSERFAELNSFSLRNFAFFGGSEEKCELQTTPERESEGYSLEDPLYNVLSLRRGKSECFAEDDPFVHAQQYFVEQPTALFDIDIVAESRPRSQCLSSCMDPLPAGHGDWETDSKTLLSSCSEALARGKEPAQTKVSTKNVTKNMGKLLFKYIWKNRISLRQNFDVTAEEWEEFVGEVRVWKKENNITREYLNSRWHCAGSSSRLFRIISHNFFRRRCLSAILESKIECKEMHIKRLRRFQEAPSSATALDSLN